MAKHNLILGTATRSLGDVTLYRRGGQQVARARVRTIANPRSEGQAYQRACVAPVMRFFAPLSRCLEKSWEGKNKSDSVTAFSKVNINLARANRWVLPRGSEFFPFPYQISSGTLTACGAEVIPEQNAIYIDGAITQSAKISDITAAFKTIGADFEDGDQITLLAIVRNGSSFTPQYMRFFLDVLDTRDFNDVYARFYCIGNRDDDYPASVSFQPKFQGDGIVAGAIIHSKWRRGRWRRSSELLDVSASFLNDYLTNEATAAAIASYRDEETANPSDVYLNGEPEEQRRYAFPNDLEGSTDTISDFKLLSLNLPEAGSQLYYVCTSFTTQQTVYPVLVRTKREGGGFVYLTNSGFNGVEPAEGQFAGSLVCTKGYTDAQSQEIWELQKAVLIEAGVPAAILG